MRTPIVFCLALIFGCSSNVQAPEPVETPPVEAEEVETPPVRTVIEPPTTQLGRPLDEATLGSLMACWFESPYPYMFGGSSLTVGNGSFGTLRAGIRGILYYGDLNNCAGRISGTPPRSYSDDRPFAALSNLPLYSDQMHEGQPFGYYNPDIIKWGQRNLIPEPNTTVLGVRVQVIYERIFSRFFRVMTEAYLYLVDSGRYHQDMQDYLSMAHSPSADGLDWLEGRYSGALAPYAAGWDGTTMTPAMAIGFWLRRGIDGTADDLWIALRDLMGRYDRQWYDSLPQTYTSSEIQW